MKILITIVLCLLLPTHAFSLVNMPSATLDIYLPEKKENIYTCKKHNRLEDIAAAQREEAFNLYALNYALMHLLIVDIPFRKKIYEIMRLRLEEELKSDPNISKYAGESSEGSWVVPDTIDQVYTTWVDFLNNEKQKIEKNLCYLEWYKSQNKQHSNIPSKFIESYNFLYDSYQELESRCIKPNVKGWTQDQSAKDYDACLNSRRGDYNRALRKLKSYQSLRNEYMKILEPLGKAGELKPPYE